MSIITALFSCNNKPCPSCDGENKREAFTGDSLKYQSFVLDRAMISAEPRLAKRTPPDNFDRLILKFIFESQVSDTLNLKLKAFPAKGSGANQHGQGEGQIELKKIDTLWKKLSKELLLGNVYVDWKFIKTKIYEPGSDALIANFSHIIFIPREKTPLMTPPWDGNLHYGIIIKGLDGKTIFPIGGAGGDNSNPSPPATPNF